MFTPYKALSLKLTFPGCIVVLFQALAIDHHSKWQLMLEMTASNLLTTFIWPFQFLSYTTIFPRLTSLAMKNLKFFTTYYHSPASHAKAEGKKKLPKSSILMQNSGLLKNFSPCGWYVVLRSIIIYEWCYRNSWISHISMMKLGLHMTMKTAFHHS